MNMDMHYTTAHIILYKRFCTNVVINAPTAGLKFVESEGNVIQDERIAESMTSKPTKGAWMWSRRSATAFTPPFSWKLIIRHSMKMANYPYLI